MIYIDRFGNAITNLEGGLARAGTICEVHGKQIHRCPLGRFYQAVPPGKACGLPGSSGYLEIAVNAGSAAKVLGIAPGTRIVLRKVG